MLRRSYASQELKANTHPVVVKLLASNSLK